MIKQLDFISYEWRNIRLKYFFSRKSIKYILLIMFVIAIFIQNKAAILFVMFFMILLSFLEDYNAEDFLAYRNKKYGWANAKEKRLFKWMGLKKK